MDCTKILAQLTRLQARLPDPKNRTLPTIIAQRIDAEADAGRITAGQWADLLALAITEPRPRAEQ